MAPRQHGNVARALMSVNEVSDIFAAAGAGSEGCPQNHD
jgi:hypothetical protein